MFTNLQKGEKKELVQYKKGAASQTGATKKL